MNKNIENVKINLLEQDIILDAVKQVNEQSTFFKKKHFKQNPILDLETRKPTVKDVIQLMYNKYCLTHLKIKIKSLNFF